MASADGWTRRWAIYYLVTRRAQPLLLGLAVVGLVTTYSLTWVAALIETVVLFSYRHLGVQLARTREDIDSDSMVRLLARPEGIYYRLLFGRERPSARAALSISANG